MRHGERPLVFRTVGGKSPKSSIVPRMVRAKGERPRAKERTAREKARGMERKEVERKAANLRRVDALSAGESIGRPSVPRTPSRKEVVSPKPGNKGDTSRKR